VDHTSRPFCGAAKILNGATSSPFPLLSLLLPPSGDGELVHKLPRFSSFPLLSRHRSRLRLWLCFPLLPSFPFPPGRRRYFSEGSPVFFPPRPKGARIGNYASPPFSPLFLFLPSSGFIKKTRLRLALPLSRHSVDQAFPWSSALILFPSSPVFLEFTRRAGGGGLVPPLSARHSHITNQPLSRRFRVLPFPFLLFSPPSMFTLAVEVSVR